MDQIFIDHYFIVFMFIIFGLFIYYNRVKEIDDKQNQCKYLLLKFYNTTNELI